MTKNICYATAQVMSTDGRAPGTHNPRLESMRVAADAAYKDLAAGRITADSFNKAMARIERDVEAERTASRSRSKALQYVANSDSAKQFSANGGVQTKGGCWCCDTEFVAHRSQ